MRDVDNGMACYGRLMGFLGHGKEFLGFEKGTTRLVLCPPGRSPYTTFNTINETINIVDLLFSDVKTCQQSLAWFARTRWLWAS